MYHKLSAFKQDWLYETSATLKVFECMKEDIKTKKLTVDIRSLERLAWHITQTIPEMAHKAGLFEKDNLANLPVPGSIQIINDTYQQQSEHLIAAIDKNWTDGELETKVNMYGDEWEKGRILSILIRHQSHHRGQMTVIMRILGLSVPGVYGPSKEEWVKYGMPVLE